VFANLLDNSAKYTKRGGQIWVIAERQGNEAVVSVRDTGIGIPAEQLPGVFDIFTQVTPALEKSQGGLGVGLALVKGLVELHGGSVEAHSNSGMGSVFIVRLPTASIPENTTTQQACDDSNDDCSIPKCRILVADDNKDAAYSFEMILRKMGHDVYTAHDGLAAIQAAAAQLPRVILLDIGMPGMNGYEAAKHIREQPWGEKVVLIAVTGWGQDDDRRRAYEAGFDYHMVKPVALGDLKKVLSRLLKQ
jgi:CheY-like chemotaxis protein